MRFLTFVTNIYYPFFLIICGSGDKYNAFEFWVHLSDNHGFFPN